MATKKSQKIEAVDNIIVRGARTHNLKNITVEMPRHKMIVFTGLSGSGKSSLAFDTIFAEGQRRYVESLSAYARQFLNQMQKPDVDEIVVLSGSTAFFAMLYCDVRLGSNSSPISSLLNLIRPRREKQWQE
jgi:ABC-type transporter Mla maintaining outer membrane lipid asymmetry ATPase subunit MlaF